MIKNIIFDFGAIFINLNKNATLQKILEKYPDFLLTEELIKINNAYETGVISTDNFIAYYKTILPQETKESLIAIWNAIIQTIPKERLTFIENLNNPNTYRLFLLSNTNELHIQQVKKNIGRKVYNSFKACFEKFYLSHEINMRKPDKQIFEYVLEQNKLLNSETLFIDDTLEHIQSAQELGIHTWHLIPGENDITTLKERLY